MRVLSFLNHSGLRCSLLGTSLLIAGCAHKIEYAPQDFINPNRVVTEKVPIQAPPTQVKATFSYGNDPEVVKAYRQFSKNGKEAELKKEGFITYAYSPEAHPILECSPIQLCAIQLEQGEHVNGVFVGDNAHWVVLKKPTLIGTPQNGSEVILVEPKLYDIATDLYIATDKRAYTIGLVSKEGASTHVLSFYYPDETLASQIAKVEQTDNSPLQSETVSTTPVVNVDHINFNYSLKGKAPWQPSRVFDDGTKTFIEMPGLSERMDLPVLYVLKGSQMQMINYRYKRPYYVVDGLFQQAVLVSGKGVEQERVLIDNRNFS